MKMNNQYSVHKVLLLLLILAMGNAGADSPQDQIARLGNDLTPLGGEKAGNKDGTIPAWTGGITKSPAGYTEGSHFVDPYPEDKILFTIDASNISQYESNLSEGHKALLKTYPDTYKLNVYPSRRTASAPQHIYDATREAAGKAQLTEGGNGVSGTTMGIPFPIPSNGQEVIWNHLLRYRGENVIRKYAQAAPTRSGDYNLVQISEELAFQYNRKGKSEAKLNNLVALFKQEVTAPARLAGGILLVHETLDQKIENRKAWLYNPGQRRVRRAPNVAFDNPGTASDGMRTSDQLDMFNGSLERYDWNLVGKKEIYVPYNCYKIHSPDVKYEQILTPLHINQDLPRYELHRVWVVDAVLKNGARHLYKRRTFYVDEDSWQVLIVDQYDNRDNLWRVSEGFAINYYNLPTLWTTLEVHTDLQAGRYLAFGLYNESVPYDFDKEMSEDEFTPSALRRAGRR